MRSKIFIKNVLLGIAIFIFVVLIVLRLFFLKYPNTIGHSGLIWAMIYNILAIWGGVCGLYVSKFWGGSKSLIGKVSMIFALGLFLQAFGQNVYNYFYFTRGFDITVPYPSVGDIGYFGSVLAYIYGVCLLAKATGVKVSLKSFSSKIQAVVIPLVLLIASYLVFLKNYQFDWSHPITIFLDFGYPLGQAIYISIAILVFILSRKYLGGLMKKPIMFFLAALVIQYLCDFTFLYQANNGTFVAGGINDFMYLISYFVMTFSLIELGAVFYRIKNS